MKVAVVGAGLAGIAVAWHLLELSKASISLDIFDPTPIGEGVSGSASGLLNPYTGLRAILNWKGEEMIKEAHHLLSIAAPYCDSPPVISTGILRIALDQEQLSLFPERANDKECIWWTKEILQNNIPFLTLPEECGALYVKTGVTVNVKVYIKGLMQAILRLGAHWQKHAITDPSIFADYDRVVIAMGAQTSAFTVFENLPMSKIKGQVLEVAWPAHLPPLPMSIAATSHIVMSPDRRSCLIGATFERDYTHAQPDKEFAKKSLLTKAGALIPGLENEKIIDCKSGIRVCPGTHKPLLGQLNDRFWFFTGLCAKGLLYHGYLGKKMAQAVLANDKELIPKEVYHQVVIT